MRPHFFVVAVPPDDMVVSGSGSGLLNDCSVVGVRRRECDWTDWILSVDKQHKYTQTRECWLVVFGMYAVCIHCMGLMGNR